MLQILGREEAEKWCEKNLYEADCFINPMKIAVRNGLLIAVDDNQFAVAETECFGCTWVIDEIRRLTDEEMKEQDLHCRYCYKEHVISVPEKYSGAREIIAGFNL